MNISAITKFTGPPVPPDDLSLISHSYYEVLKSTYVIKIWTLFSTKIITIETII